MYSIQSILSNLFHLNTSITYTTCQVAFGWAEAVIKYTNQVVGLERRRKNRTLTWKKQRYRQSDGLTDRRIDGCTNTASCKVMCTWPKTFFFLVAVFRQGDIGTNWYTLQSSQWRSLSSSLQFSDKATLALIGTHYRVLNEDLFLLHCSFPSGRHWH